MLEQHPTSEQKPQPPQEGIELPREEVLYGGTEVEQGFRARECEIFENAGNVLDKAKVEELKKPSSRTLAAALVFCAASNTVNSSAEAGGIFHELTFGSADIIQSVAKEESVHIDGNKQRVADFKTIKVPFAWERIVGKLTESGDKQEESNFDFESIDGTGYSHMEASSFYTLKKSEYLKMSTVFEESLRSAPSAASFFESLPSLDLSEQQKVGYLQQMGWYLANTYNYDMLKNKEYVVVSDQKMFEGVQELAASGKITPTGMCGNIHTFLVNTAKNMGFDAWLQNGILRREDAPVAGHVWMGLVVKDSSGKEQIAFLDYDTLIPTGTMNYRDALGIYERRVSQISTFRSYVGSTQEVVVAVKSLAQETMERAAGFQGSEQILEGALQTGKTENVSLSSLSVSESITTIKLSQGMVAFNFTRMEDVEGNPYQALQSMDALRGTVHFGGKKFGGEFETTILNVAIKDLAEGSVFQTEIINRLAGDFINSHNFSKKEYGDFVLRYGASIEAGVRKIIGDSDNSFEPSSGRVEGSVGAKIFYTDPAKIGTLYFGASDTQRILSSDFQDQEIRVKSMSGKIALGGEFKVHESTVLNFGATTADLPYGEKHEVRIGLAGSNMGVNVKGEQIVSDMKSTMPSSEKVVFGVTHNSKNMDGPRFKMSAQVFNEKKTYNNSHNKSSGAEIKLEVHFW